MIGRLCGVSSDGGWKYASLVAAGKRLGGREDRLSWSYILLFVSAMWSSFPCSLDRWETLYSMTEIAIVSNTRVTRSLYILSRRLSCGGGFSTFQLFALFCLLFSSSFSFCLTFVGWG